MRLESLSQVQIDPRAHMPDHHENLGSTAFREGLATYIVDKGFEPEAMRTAIETGAFGYIVGSQLLGLLRQDSNPGELVGMHSRDLSLIERAGVTALYDAANIRPTYTGSNDDNRRYMEASLKASRNDREVYSIRRNGALRIFHSGGYVMDAETDPAAHVPIAVIGAGAAGTIATAALHNVGFQNVHTYDKAGKTGGIWTNRHVNEGSKNNPFPISFEDILLDEAFDVRPGTGSTILNFLTQIDERYNTLLHPETEIINENINFVTPGDLDHRVHTNTGNSSSYPIIINAAGLGVPLTPNHPGEHMRAEAEKAGIRWQKQLSRAELDALRGKRVVFIGMGNSTLEMVTQLLEYEQSTGERIDYKVLTHYGQEAVRNPQRATVGQAAIARNIDVPELTKAALDLNKNAKAYRTMLDQGRIVTDVASWKVADETGRKVLEVCDKSGIEQRIPFEQLFTLIGYGHRPETLNNMGITVTDNYRGYGAYDFDGEVQAQIGALGRERVYPGYFAIGPLLKNEHNPNAIVIPGIQYQLTQLLPSIVLRAFEYAYRHPERLTNEIVANKETGVNGVSRLKGTDRTSRSPF